VINFTDYNLSFIQDQLVFKVQTQTQTCCQLLSCYYPDPPSRTILLKSETLSQLFETAIEPTK